MTKGLVSGQYLDDIADSIRAKNGSSDTYKPSQMAAAIDNIPSGGGGSRPSTWSEFAAMTTAQQQAVYGVGDRVGITCDCVVDGSTISDLLWEIAGWGTTRKENDSTNYPCVTLISRFGVAPNSREFDASETAVKATEETARAGIYYFGYNGSTYTALNLSEGDTIPYSDYTNVYKTDVTDNATIYNGIRNNGYDIYHYSAIRKWINATGGASAWWGSTHVGDARPSYYNKAGLLNGMNQDFKSILQKTEVATAGDGLTDDGGLIYDYDYLFIPSAYELYLYDNPVEGDRMPYFINMYQGSLRVRGPLASIPSPYLTRSVRSNSGVAHRVWTVGSTGSMVQQTASAKQMAVLACKIILRG